MKSSLFKIIQKNRLPIFVCFLTIVLIAFAWKDIAQMIMRGDGFVYLVKRTQIQYWNPPSSLANFDQGATLVAKLLTFLFGVNISLYYWTELIFMVIIGILFFAFIYIVTSSTILSFSATLIFSINYFGNFNMYANGVYSFFLERIVNMAGIIPSLIYLHLFLSRSKWKYFWVSVIFYFVSVGFSHWFVLFTPAFFLYPIAWYLFREKNKKTYLRYLLTTMIYPLLSSFFILIQQINQSGLGPKKWGFIEFLLNPGIYDYPEKILRQLVYWSSYVPYNYIPDAKSAIVVAPYVLAIYLITNIFCYIYLDNSKKYLIFWSFISCLAIFFLNSYFGQYDILNQFGANRYLYLPTFLLAVFWSVILWQLFFKRKKKVLMSVGIIFLSAFYLVNYSLIDHHLKLVFRWDRQTKVVFDYIVKNNSKYPEGTLIITPYDEVNWYEVEFFNDYLDKKKVLYAHERDPQLFNLQKEMQYVYKIKYSSNCDCVLETKVR